METAEHLEVWPANYICTENNLTFEVCSNFWVQIEVIDILFF